jgi:hypothetical protein
MWLNLAGSRQSAQIRVASASFNGRLTGILSSGLMDDKMDLCSEQVEDSRRKTSFAFLDKYYPIDALKCPNLTDTGSHWTRGFLFPCGHRRGA